MPNTAEGDFENAKRHNCAWRRLEAMPEEERLELWAEAWNSGFYAGEIAGHKQAREERPS